MLRHSFFTIIAALFVVTSLGAAEPDSQTKASAFTICGGNCSRSIRVVSTHATAHQALTRYKELAEKGGYRYLGVGSGENVKPYAFHPSFTETTKPQAYSVYRIGSKSSELRGTLESHNEALLLAKKIANDQESAVVVFDFSTKLPEN